MNNIEITETHYFEAKFRATFQNAITRLKNDEKLVSKTFIVRDIPWNIRLEIHPFYQPQKISCCLDCLETKLEFSYKASCKFSAIRASDPPFEKEKTTTFDASLITGGFPNFFSLSKLSNLSEGFIFDDALTIQVELKIDIPLTLNYKNKKEELIQSLQPSSTNDLIQDMDLLLESGNGDVTFKLRDGGIIKGHTNVLCIRNAVFATMLSVDMKEANTMEVTIDDMGKVALKILLLYIYTGQLSLPEELDLDTCKEVVNAAEKYNLPALRDVAGMALAEIVIKDPKDAFEQYKFLKGLNVAAATRVLASYIMSNTKEMLDKC